jgi:hypothetical protein
MALRRAALASIGLRQLAGSLVAGAWQIVRSNFNSIMIGSELEKQLHDDACVTRKGFLSDRSGRGLTRPICGELPGNHESVDKATACRPPD